MYTFLLYNVAEMIIMIWNRLFAPPSETTPNHLPHPLMRAKGEIISGQDEMVDVVNEKLMTETQPEVP